MLNRVISSCVALFGVSVFAANAQAATVINFDSLTTMSNVPGTTVPDSAKLSNQFNLDSSSPGVVFSSSAPYVAAVFLSPGTPSVPNGIGGVTATGKLSYADVVRFTFFVPGTSTPGVTDFFSIQADLIGISSNSATVTIFDINGVAMGHQTLADVGGETWSFSKPGIHSAEFLLPTVNYGIGVGIALDNLSFNAVTAPAPAAPLPLSAVSGLTLLALLAPLAFRRRSSRGL